MIFSAFISDGWLEFVPRLNLPMHIQYMHHILYVGLSFMLQGVVKFYRECDLFEKEKKTIEEHLSIYKVSSSKIVINLPRTYEKLHGEPYRFSCFRVSFFGTDRHRSCYFYGLE